MISTLKLRLIDGSSLLIRTQMYCDVPVKTVLRDGGTYALLQGDLVIAKVRAYNDRGWSAYSLENTSACTTCVKIQTQPVFMNQPIRGSTTNPT